MSYLGDIAKDVVAMAGKAPDLEPVALRILDGVIETINREVAWGALRSRYSATLASGERDIILPVDCRTVDSDGVGEEDTTTGDIKYPYVETREDRLDQILAGQTRESQGWSNRYWYPVEKSQAGGTGAYRERIRIYPAADAALTVQVRYYATLNKVNVDQLGYRQLLVDGAKAQLSGWFPNTAALDYRMFLNGIESLRMQRVGTKRTAPYPQSASAVIHNATAAGLVE